MLKRIYYDNGNGSNRVFATDYCRCDKTGEIKVSPRSKKTQLIVKKSDAINSGMTVLNASELSQNNLKMVNKNGTIGLAETADGLVQSFRHETSSSTSSDQFIWFKFVNTSDSDQEFMLGDPFNYAAVKLGLSTLSGAVTVDGSFGDLSLAMMKSPMAIDVHNLKLVAERVTLAAAPSASDTPVGVTASEASDAVYQNNELISIVTASPTGRQAKVDPFNLIAGIQKNDFVKGIRDYENFRMQFNFLQSMKIKLKSLDSLTITMAVSSVGNVHGMTMNFV